MRKIIFTTVLISTFYTNGFAQDTCTSRINFALQISIGSYYSNCTNIPTKMINKPEPVVGLQLNPQVGFNVNWNLLRLGLCFGIIAQKEIREYGEFNIGPKIQLSAEIGNFKNYFPLSFYVLGGCFLQIFTSRNHVQYSPPYSSSFFIGCAPLVRLSKKHSHVFISIGPSVEYFFGITKNFEYFSPGPQKGGTSYSFNYNEITGNILLLLKFQKRKMSKTMTVPPYPPFF